MPPRPAVVSSPDKVVTIASAFRMVSFMYLLYSALLALFLLLTLPYWLLQMMRHGKYRAGLRQRFGAVPSHLTGRAEKKTIWVHAVSVGEVVASSAVVAALQEKLPSHQVMISTTTSTGQKLAAQRFGAENVFYFPLDFGFAVRPYINALCPKLVVIAETEFWPNFLRIAKRNGSRIAIINCRISDRSLPGYKRLRFLLTKVLKNVDLFLAQTEEDRERLIKIGAPESKVTVAGNLKFDMAPPPSPKIVASLHKSIQQSGATPVLVQPEGAAADAAGNVYVADRAQDRVVKFDPRGKILDASHVKLQRPRALALGGDGALWIAADGPAEAPWARGPGEIWRVVGDAAPALMRRGPVAAGMALSSTGHLFVADRQAPDIFALAPDGRVISFARFTDGDAPRSLTFAPVTPETERAGIAGSLFVVAIAKGAWPVNRRAAQALPATPAPR